MFRRSSVLLIASVAACTAYAAPSITNGPEPVCSYLEHASNVALKGRPESDSAFPVPEALAGRQMAFRDRLDINGDGKPEYVYIAQPPPRNETEGEIDGVPDTIRLPVPYFFVYSRNLAEINLRLEEDPARYLGFGDSTQLIEYRGTYYIVVRKDEQPHFVLKIDRSNIARRVCAFTDHALTTTEWLHRSIRSPRRLWEYAFSSDHFALAELLLANGHSVDETVEGSIGDEPLLLWAYGEKRPDIVDWLLDHHANPNTQGHAESTLLQAALQTGDVRLIRKLLRYGADPSRYIHEVSDFIDEWRAGARPVVIPVVTKLGYVPEEFLIKAVDKDPGLLDLVAASGVKVRPLGVSWRAGKPMTVPFWLAMALDEQGESRVARSVDRILKRGSVPPESVYAAVSYGSFTNGVLIDRYEGSTVSDDELLRFATAFCDSFTQFDCGTEDMVTGARAWVSTLSSSCPENFRGALDDTTCRLAGYYVEVGKRSVTAFPLDDVRTGPAVNGKWLIDRYRAKHAR